MVVAEARDVLVTTRIDLKVEATGATVFVAEVQATVIEVNLSLLCEL